MLTIFTVPKPFEGHIGTIQRNAILSWTRLDPDCQVIICGDEAGCRELAAELGLDHLADVELNEFGTPLVSSVFRRAEESARHDILCYANADLVFFPDLLDAISRIVHAYPRFLAVGEAWNLDLEGELPAKGSGRESELRDRVTAAGELRGRDWIDFFVFRRGTLGRLPDFAVGRPVWDNWMIWRARSLRMPVIDVSLSVLVIHQLHGYGHVKHARGDRWDGPEADFNRSLLRFGQRFSLDDATHRLTRTELVRRRNGGLRHRLGTELLLHSWTVPLNRAQWLARDRLRRLTSRA